MALLIDIDDPDWMTDEKLAHILRPLLPGVDVRCARDVGTPEAIEMLAVARLKPGQARRFPNLKLIQKLGAGVETIVAQPDLPPAVKIARLKPATAAREIAAFSLGYVLREQRDMAYYEDAQRSRAWSPREPREAAETTVGVLGLGHIGGQIAATFAALGYNVMGWSRSLKTLEGVVCHAGQKSFFPLLGACDYVVSALPSTPQTQDLLGSAAFAAMKPGSVLINVGRGDLIVEAALLSALDNGHLSRAVLDVQRQEPLPNDHPFWSHPKITVTPHVSGWHLTGGLADVAENYRRLQAGQPLLHEVDRNAGY
ncbi:MULTISPECIES: glyoxylate/hydroxypyruvate reductase A [Limibacillus]|jgi:glyoxylate/hydroxypyruvate reductase A|uniref:Glyoxylate/hydroxypyruvate reductase A n=1 Tax=Limibacillus halophilus TaxID=1579333 RepID=A0A839SX78_9PROT|nr:glyoxylate/hydroxypyruvate reductase A [Limibacillus halophilus]MBB3066254.1 glyoxylate/hydroxypyruvate reductase A [Limibacillus halophilus]